MGVLYKKNDVIRKYAGYASADIYVSDKYLPSKTYNVGDYCIYKNKLWKKIGATELGVTPTEGTSWTQTKVSSEIGNLSQLAINFSKSEQKTGNKSVDGKPIYVNTLKYNENISDNTSFSLSGLNIDKIEDITFVFSLGSEVFSSFFMNNYHRINAKYDTNSKTMTIETTSAITVYNLTIYYTKN